MSNYCICRDTSRSRFQVALDLQDGCNLRAIARSLVRAVDEVAERNGTAASYCDPAVVLIVNKIESLVHSDQGLNYSKAYDFCKTVIGE